MFLPTIIIYGFFKYFFVKARNVFHLLLDHSRVSLILEVEEPIERGFFKD